MLTARGWWFLILVGFVVVLGATVIANYTVVPAILGLTLLAWFGFEWIVFQVRSHGAAARLRVDRRIMQGGRDVPMVWAGLPFQVWVRVGHDGPAGVPYAELEDRLPAAAEMTAGQHAAAADLPPGEPARITYTLTAPAPGVVRFEGVAVRIADIHGFFFRRAFLRDPIEFLALPPLTDDEGRQRATKRFNTLPAPGVHRFRRPGTSSELLDLRDYRPGDPPKMIAWKPSARRDRLITKEFESDVPVRCVLFLDTSEAMRLGPPGNTPLSRMAGVASVIAQASTGNRDLVGLTTFDETQAQGAAPGRTKLHIINVLRRLAEVSALQPSAAGVPPDHLTHRAYPLAHEIYPELITTRVNTMPLGRLWLPLLDRWWGWFVFVFILLIPLLILSPYWAGWVVHQAPWARPALTPIVGAAKWWVAQCTPPALKALKWVGLPWGIRNPMGLFILLTVLIHMLRLLACLPPIALGCLFWFFYGFRGWFGERRRELTRRKQMAALLALQDGTGPAAVERLIHDDEAYTERISRFFQEHQTRCPVPLYDDHGQYRYRCAGKVEVLAGAMVRAVSRARDNELYVLMADLIELGHELGPVLKAARVARSRHHQVLVIVPWPADVPPPDDSGRVPGALDLDDTEEPRRPKGKGKGKRRHGRGPLRVNLAAAREALLLPLVRDSLVRQYHQAFRDVRRALSRVGASVIRVNEGDTAHLVLDRLDRLRGMRSRR